MWLARLDLLAFGHFTDLRLHLGPGLHLVYGPNEAGKTTTLRAIRQLLFGFDERTRDNFVHQNSNLRIGGLIRNHAGIELEVIRRKTRKDSLRGIDEATTIDDGVWQNVLCGIDEATFSNRYGIDYEQLVKGGHEIATGTGDLGEILFATGSGVSDLTSVQKRLSDEAAELFRPQGKKQRLNQAIVEWQEQRELVAKQQLSVAEWEDVDRQRRDTQIRLDAVCGELSLKDQVRDQYRRMLKSWPLVREQTSLEQRLSELAAAKRLPNEFMAMRQEASLLLSHADSHESAAAKTRQDAERQLECLAISPELLSKADELTQLFADWGSYSKAQLDRPQLVNQLEHHVDICRNLLSDLGPSASAAQEATIEIDRVEITKLNQLGRKKAGLVQAVQQAEMHCERIQRRLDETRQKLERLPVARSSQPLRDAIRQARCEGDLETQLEKVNGEIESLTRERRSQLERLGLWTGSIEKLKEMRVPTLESVRDWEIEFTSNQNEQSILKSRLDDLESECQQRRKQLDELQRGYDLPTEIDLSNTRSKRDDLLNQIRQAVEAKKVPKKAIIDSFAQTVAETDRIVDLLRSEATLVAQVAEQKSEFATLESRKYELQSKLNEFDDSRTNLEQRWQAEWGDLGAKAFSPREMQTWLAHRETLLLNHAQIARHSVEAKQLVERAKTQISILSQLLFNAAPFGDQTDVGLASRENDLKTVSSTSRQQLSFGWDHNFDHDQQIRESPGSGADLIGAHSLEELLLRAEDQLKQDEALATARKETEEAHSRLLLDQKESLDQMKRAQDELQQWQTEWETRLADLNIALDLSPDAADAFLQTLSELFDHRRQAEQLRLRIVGIAADAEQFESKVKRMCESIASDLLPLTTTDAVTKLRDRLLAGQKDLATFNEQTARKAQAEHQLVQSRQTRAKGMNLVNQLCTMAGLNAPVTESLRNGSNSLAPIFDTLIKIEADSQHRLQLEDQLERVQKQLVELAAEMPLSEHLEQVRQASLEHLNVRVGELDVECLQLAEERDRLNRQLGGFDEQLQRMDGSAVAAEAEEKQRQLLAQMRSDVEQYARTKLASSVLHAAVERYRDKIRGPVLTVASELFRELTLGSFDGLRVDEDNNSHPVLVGLRNGGREIVSVDGMSEGTCDQLYLALKLASLTLETAPRSHLPFIVDDILIQFDDARSAAALRILARLGRQRQVIFFTHHEHLLDIARQHLADDCTIQRLNR
jgi:uncharacterized protein YhaN